MTLHLSGAHHRSQEQQHEVREARRLMREKVRTDWTYPPLPAWKSSGRDAAATATATQDVEARIAGFRFHTATSSYEDGGRATHGVVAEALGLGFEPVEWREREVSSDGEDEVEVESSERERERWGLGLGRKGGGGAAKSKDGGSTCRFEAPETVGAQVRDRKLARKRRRWAVLRQEMEWNDGLAHWMRRRDRWCCARATAEVRLLEGGGGAAALTGGRGAGMGEGAGDVGEDHASQMSASSDSPRASSSSAPEEDAEAGGAEGDDDDDDDDGDGDRDAHPAAAAAAAARTTPNSTPSISPSTPNTQPTEPLLSPTTTTTTTMTSTTSPSPPLPLDILLPLAPPLLPNHPVRRRIAPTMYPEIYTKIIVQSRTPSVPINLRHLIDAMVQGWKDDGEWPPKMGPLEKAIGRKKGGAGAGGNPEGGGSLRQGVKAVGRVLRLTGTGAGDAKA